MSNECDLGYSPAGSLICQADGSWSDYHCLRMANCKDVLACNPSFVNGEYWVRPEVLNYQLLRVYCHKMDAVPKDCISLDGENYSYFLDSDVNDCNAPWVGQHQGMTVFDKMVIDINNMAFMTTTYNFATTNGTLAPFGQAADCRFNTQCTSNQAGSFRIDMTGTGLKIASSVTWNIGTLIRKQNNGSIVLGDCFGGCGVCHDLAPGFVYDMLQLEYDMEFVPELASAIVPVCTP